MSKLNIKSWASLRNSNYIAQCPGGGTSGNVVDVSGNDNDLEKGSSLTDAVAYYSSGGTAQPYFSTGVGADETYGFQVPSEVMASFNVGSDTLVIAARGNFAVPASNENILGGGGDGVDAGFRVLLRSADGKLDSAINRGAQKGVGVSDNVIAKNVDGTTTSTTSNKLVDSGASFTSAVLGATVFNNTDNTSTVITAVDSGTTLSVADDIFASGEDYEIAQDVDLLIAYDTVNSKVYIWVDGEIDANVDGTTDLSAGGTDTYDFPEAFGLGHSSGLASENTVRTHWANFDMLVFEGALPDGLSAVARKKAASPRETLTTADFT